MFYGDTGFALKHLADFMSLELILRETRKQTQALLMVSVLRLHMYLCACVCAVPVKFTLRATVARRVNYNSIRLWQYRGERSHAVACQQVLLGSLIVLLFPLTLSGGKAVAALSAVRVRGRII